MDSLALFHRFTAARNPTSLTEAWGDVVPAYDAGGWGDGAYGSTLSRYQRPATTLYDRNEGRYLPVYQTEFDLAVIRAMSRTLACVAPGLVGGLRNLCNYTIGEGFTFTATREPAASLDDEAAAPLVQAVQTEINTLLDDNEFVSGLDREIHDCSVVDGESLLHVRPNAAGQVRIYRREPDELRQPANTRELEEWVQDAYGVPCDSFVSCWSFGVHTRADQPDEPLGYHLVSDESGVNWEYVPADRMVHIKRNVTRNAKRGFSDFYPVEPDSTRGEKLRRNMAEGAALQSAIAFVRQHVAGTTRVGVETMLGDNKAGTSRPQMGGGTGRARSVVQYAPGTVVDISAGIEYLPGPLGSERASDFLLVAAYVQRMQAVRWSMPEYMFSGDASNANYASTMEATAPFVKSCEAEQRFYSRYFVALLWKALKVRWEMGAFDEFNVEWETLLECIKLTAECPEVATRDELQNVQRQEILIRLGILSRKTAASQNGLDYEAEVASGAAPEGKEGGGEPGGAAPGGPVGGPPPEGPAPGGGSGAAPPPEGAARECHCDDNNAAEAGSEAEPTEPVTESILLECGGKGGKPGPCRKNRVKVKPASKKRKKKVETAKTKHSKTKAADAVPAGKTAKAAAPPKAPHAAKAKGAKGTEGPAGATVSGESAAAKAPDEGGAGGDKPAGKAKRRKKKEPPDEGKTATGEKAARKDKPNTKPRQEYAAKVQKAVSDAIGGETIGDNAPSDYRVVTESGGVRRIDHFEHKTLLDRESNTISGRTFAMERKARVVADTGQIFHMSVCDDRESFGDPSLEGRGEKVYYYKRGAFAGPLSEMHKVSSLEELRELMLRPDDLLPDKAKEHPRWTAMKARAKADKSLGGLRSAAAKHHQGLATA